MLLLLLLLLVVVVVVVGGGRGPSAPPPPHHNAFLFLPLKSVDYACKNADDLRALFYFFSLVCV